MKTYISPEATPISLLSKDVITASWFVGIYDEDQNSHSFWDLQNGFSNIY